MPLGFAAAALLMLAAIGLFALKSLEAARRRGATAAKRDEGLA
ncbi:MAG: hypothetical protein ACK41C_18495 [Phenylobacterium sp.]|jgi:hypothetical protein